MGSQPPLSSSAAPPSSNGGLPIMAYGALSASLVAGYGVLFSIAGDYRDEYGISETTVGLVIGIGFIAGFVAQLFVAPVADRGHARTVVVVSVVVNAIGLAMLGLGTTAVTIITGRVISGLAIGSAGPAIRRIVVAADPANIGRNLGRLVSADVFGFALGPAVSAVLVDPYGLAAPFLLIAAVSLVIVAVSYRAEIVEPREVTRHRMALDLLADRTFAGTIVLGAAMFLMFGAFDALWDMVHTDLGTANWMANLGITLFALPVVVLGPTGGRMSQAVGPLPVAAVGLLVSAAFMAAYGLVPTGGWIFSLALVHGFSDGLTVSSTGIAVGLTAPEHRQAGAQGVLGASQALVAGMIAPVTASLYQSAGRAVAYGAAAAATVGMVAVGLVLIRAGRTDPDPTSQVPA
jgi:MFS family permease